jgi:hypothetical protein
VPQVCHSKYDMQIPQKYECAHEYPPSFGVRRESEARRRF